MSDDNKEIPNRIGRILTKIDATWTTERIIHLDVEISEVLFVPVVVDCTSLPDKDISDAASSLCRLGRKVNRVDLQIVIVGASTKFAALLKNQGSNGLFVFARTEAEVEKVIAQDLVNHYTKKSAKAPPSEGTAHNPEVTAARSSIDVTMVNPFLSSALLVFKTQTGVEVHTGLPFKKDLTAVLDGEISGIIKLESTEFNGSVVISFPIATLQNLLAKMLGADKTYSLEEIKGGAGELLNIIFTKAKGELNRQGHGVKSALPSICEIPDPAIFLKIQGRVAIPFESDAGSFCIEVWGTAS